MKGQQEIERSISKKYRKTIWNRFVGALKDYDMIQEGDRIAVCISGGKDSMLLAKCMQMLCRYSDFPFEVVFLSMDPGYSPENRKRIEENAEKLGISVELFDAPIFDYVYKQEGSPCYLCARMRRGYLYKEAQLRGCNKIALGHHFDDVVETVLLNMLYQGKLETMMPKLRSTSHEGMELIRPLYLVHEEDIVAWSRYNELEFLRCACRFTEAAQTDDLVSKRLEVKQLVRQLKQMNHCADQNIFNSVHNVNLAAIVGYKYDDSESVPPFSVLYDRRSDN